VDADRFDIYIGGRGGSKVPRHGQRILESISAEKVLAVLDYVLNKYRQLGLPDERLCRVIDRCGIGSFIPPAEVYQAGSSSEESAEMDDFNAFIASK